MTSIAFVLDEWNPERGGAERAFDRFARHLVVGGHMVTVCCLRGSQEVATKREVSPRIVRVAAPPIARSLAPGRFERVLGRRLVQAAEREGCDLIVGLRHLPRADLLWAHGGAHSVALEARALARRGCGNPGGARTRIKLRGRHRVLVELERRLVSEGARRIVCVSELVRREFAALYPACRERLVVVPNGVDREHFDFTDRTSRARAMRRELNLPPSAVNTEGGVAEPLVVFLARDPELKGLDLLLQALAQLRPSPWRLIVAGPKHPAPWRRRATALDLDPTRVHFHAHLDPRSVMAVADLVVHPTWRDTSGLVILEALASGVPVITTEAAGEADLCRAARTEASSAPRADPIPGGVITTGRVDALRALLARSLEALARCAPDRAALRARTLHRGEGEWLEAMERELLAL